jgi:hypothetical protein
MKYFLSILFISILTTGSCQEKMQCNMFDRYKITSTLTGKKNEFLIKVSDNQLNKGYDWGIIRNCYCDHYHFAEFHDSTLYVIREFNLEHAGFQRELWKYTRESGEMLAAGLGIDFRVNGKQTYLAYCFGQNDSLFILNLKARNMFQVKIPNNFKNEIKNRNLKWLPDQGMIDHLKWSTTGNIIWGMMTGTYVVLGIFSYDCTSQKLETYSSPRDINSEYTLNPDSGILIYTTFPAIFDEESGKEFKESKKQVSMFEFNVRTGNKSLIAVSEAERFSPVWICADTLEYTAPDTQIRKRIKIGNE